MYKILLLIFLLGISSLHCSKDADAVDSGAGSKSGSTASQLVYNGHMYVLDDGNLRVLSLADPAHPVEIASLSVDRGSETIYPYRENLILGASNGASIIDISNPAQPRVSGSLPQFFAHDPIVVKGDTAFQTRHWGTEDGAHQGNLHILNVANSSSPFEVTQLQLTFPLGLDYKGDFLYVCNGKFGLDVIDISQALLPKKIMTTQSVHMTDCIVRDDLLIVTGREGIAIYNLSNPASPVLVNIIR